MNVDDRKLLGARRGRGGGVAGRSSGRGRGGGVARRTAGRVRGRTATESRWFSGDSDQVPTVRSSADVFGQMMDSYDDEEEAEEEETDPSDVDDVREDDEPELYTEGLRREFKHKVDVSQVSFPCKNKTDLLLHFYQANARLSRRQLDLTVGLVNDPWVREEGSTYTAGKQVIDDGPRIWPMLVPVKVTTTRTKIVASKGSVNRQRGEKRTREVPITLDQFRVPDLLERTLAHPKKAQFVKGGVKCSPAQVENTILNGAKEYRESLHALYTQAHRDSDDQMMTTPNGDFWVISHSL